MTETRQDQVAPASMAGIIERLAGEIALSEEPSRFIAALEGEEAEPDDE
jgi:hypothetical protein